MTLHHPSWDLESSIKLLARLESGITENEGYCIRDGMEMLHKKLIFQCGLGRQHKLCTYIPLP